MLPPAVVPAALRLPLRMPTLLPKMLMFPPVVPETLRVPVLMVVPAVVGMGVLLRMTSPLGVTVRLCAWFSVVPVSSWGRVWGVKGRGFAGETSRLRRCPGWLIRTRLEPGTEARVMFPLLVVRVPVLMVVPARRVRFWFGFRVRLAWLRRVPLLVVSN